MAALKGALPAIIGAANAAGADEINQVDRSLRFNSNDSAYLNRTPSVQGNLKTYTLSCWIKRSGGIGSGYERVLSSHNSDSVYMRFSGNSNYYDVFEVGGGYPQNYFTHRTEGVFRDVGGWLHLVVAVNTTESVAADRIKFYVNGVQQTGVAGGDGFIGQDRDTGMNTTSNHTIGGNASGGENLDGYLAETNFIDGQALEASDFGFYDENNNWQPKEFSGSYGTNGYYLKFADNSSTSALGTDSSGNGNTWTTNNFVVSPTTYAVAGTHSGRDGISFNGTNAVVNLSSSTDVNPGSGVFTFECYAYALSGGSNAFGIYDGSPGGNGSLVIRRVGAGTLMVERHNQAFDITGAAFSENTWHHVAVTRDSSNNVRLFVDGTQSGSTSTNNTYNYSGLFRLGRDNNEFTNGYISNLRLIKGTALYTSNFTPPTGNLGNVTNTKLLMAQSTTSVLAATVKPDDLNITAPGNYAGVDSVLDSPTNYSNGTVGGNYATFNPLSWAMSSNGGVNPGALISDGNLRSDGNGAWASAIATMAIPHTGKWYFEYGVLGDNTNIGLFKPVYDYDGTIRDSTGSRACWYGFNGTVYHWVTGYVTDSTAPDTYGSGDIIALAVDSDAFTVGYYKNGVLQYTQTLVAALQTELTAGNMFPGVDTYGGVDCTINFGQQGFAYSPPTNYKALCAENLPAPAVADGSTAFTSSLYTGNGSTQSISTTGLSPDFVWIKGRNFSGDHALFDTVRGVTKRLRSNQTNAENTDANTLTAFNSSGFSVGSSSAVNNNGYSFVAWAWDAGTSTVSNTDGNITSQVRANTTTGTSIVSYTGNGSIGQTVGHGLNSAPTFIIAKNRDYVIRWPIFHTDVGPGNALILNTTGTPTGGTGIWGNTDPTSSVFTISNDGEANRNGDDYIAYCFAPIPGFSKFGVYGGTALTNGPLVQTGFRPAWVLIKNISIVENWLLFDSARDPVNGVVDYLLPNDTGSESSSQVWLDFLSNGFKIRATNSAINGQQHSIVYMAFAEHPLKTVRAR